MSEFHRMITYLYLYERGIKNRNIGFAKIEKRDNQCLIELHMKNTGCSISPIPVYFYAQKQQQLPGILLGNMSLTRGNGDFKAVLESDNLADSGYNLDSIKGIYIPLSEQIMFVSQWDDDEFVREHFIEAAPQVRKQDTPVPLPDLQAAEAAPKLVETAPKNSETAGQTASAMQPPKKKPEPPKIVPEDWNLKWSFILENYPVMTPFAGDENTLCVRLELKDLRMLPRQYWYLGNNSFLLHGFFNYRYLILGMTEESGSKRWFLGIPGVFQNPERVMASLFGFPEFRNEKSVPVNTGEFGYWYRYLDE